MGIILNQGLFVVPRKKFWLFDLIIKRGRGNPEMEEI